MFIAHSVEKQTTKYLPTLPIETKIKNGKKE